MVSRPVRTGEPTSALTRSPGPQGDEGPPSGSREGTVITDVVGGVHPPHMPQEADTLYHVLYRKKLHFTEDRERYPLKSVAEEGAA